MPDHQCVIVGAGPVGLSLACLLKQYGLDVAVVEKLPEPAIRTKAAGIWSRSLEMLAQLDLDQTFAKAGLKSYRANIFVSGKRAAHLNLDQIPSPYNYVLMLPQNETERLLNDKLVSQGVYVKRSWELAELRQDESGVTLTSALGESLTADYVVGCDGAQSKVRQLIGIDFEGTERPNQWMVADVVMGGIPWEDEILAYVNEHKPLAVFPLGERTYRIVCEVEEPEGPKDRQQAELAAKEALSERIPEKLTIESFRDAGYFRIHQRQAKQYRQGRVFLAGDSAHVHSPLGGQGMNTGLQDAHNLAWKLACCGKGLLNSDLLDTYHKERYPVGSGVLKKTGLGTNVLTLRSPIARHLRDRVLRVAANLAPLQNKARSSLSELDVNYSHSSLSREPRERVSAWSFGKGVAAGYRAPDGPAKFTSGEEIRLYKLLKGCRFRLLLFGSDNDSGWFNFEPLAKAARRYDDLLELIWIGADLQRPLAVDREHYLMDVTGELHNQYAATVPCFYLVRPDGYIACRDLVENVGVLIDYFRELIVKE